MASATIVLRTVLGSASDWLEPRARNSNLLPVKANGEVRLRSPPCIGSGGSTGVPRPRNEPGVAGSPSRRSMVSKTLLSSAPRKIEMMAGGASLAPRRWSWPMPATLARSSAWWRLTAAMTAAQKNRNEMFSCGVSPGSSRLQPAVGPHRPVVVLARAVDAGVGLLVQQADQAVAAGHVLHDLHRQLLVVGADVGVLEDRRQLVLVGRDLVVARLGRHAELAPARARSRACRRGCARGSSRSSGRRARGPWAAWRRTACGPSCRGRGARSSTARR